MYSAKPRKLPSKRILHSKVTSSKRTATTSPVVLVWKTLIGSGIPSNMAKSLVRYHEDCILDIFDSNDLRDAIPLSVKHVLGGEGGLMNSRWRR